LSKTICIITQSHLCRNPRVLKEAIALAGAGYVVKIITAIISSELYQQDLLLIKNHPNIQFSVVSDLSKSSLHSFADRLLNRFGRLLISKFKIENSLALGYGTNRYYHKAVAAKANLYICHQEFATVLGTKLLKAGKKVAFDFEDWYSEDMLPEARAQRPIGLLRNAESGALKNSVFSITTSHALANKLAATYSVKQPEAIYNVFPSTGIIAKPKAFSTPLKLFWFSQTIGPGRGLEQFIDLLGSINSGLQLHLLGNISADYHEVLKVLMPSQHQLFIHQLVDPDELAAKIAEFDLGLALELDTPMSRDYTITNKFFQYIQSGLPVITSETIGQNEAFEKFSPGFKLSQQPTALEISALDKWLSNPAELAAARNKAIDAAAFYNWENESKKLLTLVNNALKK
jgi:glycosyltransferase involved in cell wall biosynthesis